MYCGDRSEVDEWKRHYVPYQRRNANPRIGKNLLHKISDDVMLEHIIRHLDDFDLFCNFNAINREWHGLCTSDLFWQLQIQNRMRKASVDALQHITKDCATNEQKFKKLYSLHKLISSITKNMHCHVCRSSIEKCLFLFNLKRDDTVSIELLMKRTIFDQYDSIDKFIMGIPQDSVELYYYKYHPVRGQIVMCLNENHEEMTAEQIHDIATKRKSQHSHKAEKI